MDLPELAVSLGLPEDAGEETVKTKLNELTGTNPDQKEGARVADKPTDYLRMLGLDETADPNKKIAAALNAKDEEILGLTATVTDLTQKLGEADKLNDRIADLEKRDRQRDIEVLLTRAVEKGSVLPVEKEKLAEVFAENVGGLKSLLATRPAGFMAERLTKPVGVTGDADRFVDDPDVARLSSDSTFKSDIAIDTEQGKQHLMAMEILKENGKDQSYTDDEYVAAYQQAKTAVY